MAKAKFAIMASELKSLKKSMEDRKLAELKKEIIEILKKQDEKDFKKAIDYFESQELHFTHLEKSLTSGKWVQKAGYGVGTVRIWKGKKYKKIAPGKWARVFEKEGRGTNIAIGKLIAKVQKIDNVEDLMAFVMANKQRFVDENGVDLPVLDKLRAAVDARNGNVGSKEKTVEDKIKENPDYPFKPKTDKERAERAAFEKDRDDFIERMDKIRQENKGSKPSEKKEELSWKEKVLIATDEGAKKELGRGKMYKKHITDIQKIANSNINDIPEKLKTLNDFIEYQDSLSNPDYKQAGKDYARLANHNLAREIWQKVEDGEAEWDDNGYLKLNEHGLLSKPEKKENKNAYKDGLDKDLIRNANGSSNMYEPGDAIEREFKGGLKAIDMWNLSEEDKEKAKQKLFEFSTEELKAQSGAISVTAAGPARSVKGADKKFEKVQKIRGEKQALLNELREKSRKADNQEETKKVVSSAADAIKENKLSFISEGKLYYRGNTKSNSWTVIDKIPELKDDDSIETKKNQLKELNVKSKNLGFADPEKAKVLDDINRLKNEIAYMNTDNYKLSKEGVEKSLFDDFVIDMFIDDEIEDEEELYAGETEYNDYSAEQPELFNSTAMKVREAMDRIRNQVL